MRILQALTAAAVLLRLPFGDAFHVGPSSLSRGVVPLVVTGGNSRIPLFATLPESTGDSSRRDFFSTVTTWAALLSPLSSWAAETNISTKEKIIVLGGTGMVGSEVCRQLQALGVDVVATSRDGRNGTVALDFATPGINVATTVETLAKGCTAVISCIGVIGTPNDSVINAASGLAAGGAKAAGVTRFVYISVAPEVRDFAKDIDFLQDYMAGKAFSEESVQTYFPTSFTLIEPTFIYGGDKFGLKPPRVASAYGKLVERILSSAPLRAATNIVPEGFLRIALEPPVSVEAVASAAIAGALGRLSLNTLDTHDKINDAAKLV